MDERDFFLRVSEQLGALSASVQAVLDRLERGDRKLADHERRIHSIEEGGGRGLPRWAVYLIVALASALCGALGVKIPDLF